MGTDAFNTKEEENKVVSEKSNTRMGQSSFTEDKAKVGRSVGTENQSKGSVGGASAVASMKATGSQKKSSETSQSAGNFNRGESTLKQSEVEI